jgi:hypothetical protein
VSRTVSFPAGSQLTLSLTSSQDSRSNANRPRKAEGEDGQKKDKEPSLLELMQ